MDGGMCSKERWDSIRRAACTARGRAARLLLLCLVCAPLSARATRPALRVAGSAARIIKELRKHVPGNDKEQLQIGQVIDFVQRNADPFDRRNPGGHLTASAFVVSHDGSRLLLVDHLKLGRWLQPGGHGEPGERSGLQVARRELEEETQLKGLSLHPKLRGLLDVSVIPVAARPNQPAHHDLDLRYLLVGKKNARPRHDPKENRGLAWCKWKELDKLDLDDDMRRAIGKIRMTLTSSP
jgi:8-oxo-dGTP pyrophosphatase MutT (NUDIX family)